MALSRAEMIDCMSTPDGSLDGQFLIGVMTTGVYCLPSCRPGNPPKPRNVVFFATPEEARQAGLRACKRCRPDRIAHDGQREIERPTAWLDQVAQPPGPFTFAVDDEGALLWLQFDDGDYPRPVAQELARAGFRTAADPARTAQARAELLEYCRGQRRDFTLPLALRGTPWQVAVWNALTAIPFGETRTYGEMAAALGRPGAARAMGRANATNPIALVVPCHRVIGANGALTGYGGGLHLKTRLLAHEAAVLAG